MSVTKIPLVHFSHQFGPIPLSCSDVQLLCGSTGEVLSCHSLMLATHSQLLSQALREATDKIMEDAVIILPDFSREEVIAVLDVMYGKIESCKSRKTLLSALGIQIDFTDEVVISDNIIDNIIVKEENVTSLKVKSPIQLKSRTVAVDSAGQNSGEGPPQPKMSFECPECGKLFEALETLYKHLELCEQNDEGQSSNITSQTFFKCSPCTKVFSSIDEINKHVQDCHIATDRDSEDIQQENTASMEELEYDEEDVRLMEVEETIITVGGDNKFTVEAVRGDKSFDPLHMFVEENQNQVSVESIADATNVDTVNSEDYDIRYMCNQCNEVFLTIDYLEKHQESEHQAPDGPTSIMYQCNFCKNVFNTVEEHNKHTVLEHSQFITDQVDKNKLLNFFKCSRCADSFPVVKDLTEHIIRQHSEDDNSVKRIRKKSNPELKSRCTYCLKTLNVRTELELHYKENHPGQDYGIYMCNQCNKIFRSIEYLEKHERVHQEIRPFQCGGCQAKFTLASTLHNHAKNCQSIPLNAMNRILLPTKVLEKDKKSYKCTFCKQDFPSNAAVKQHMKHICGEKKTRTVRPIYPKLSGELLHKIPISREISNAEVVFQLSESDSPSFDQAVLEGADAIFETSQPQVLDNTQDEISHKSEFDEAVTVLTHSDVLHTHNFDHNIVVLNQGPEGGISEVLINADFEEEDDGKSREKDRKFVCNYCQNRYYAKDHLLSHIRTHTGEKPFECEKCNEKFMYRSTWTNHRIRCIEGPEGMNRFRKFNCGFCSSSFLARDHLRQHERIHTGEKPWKCDQCGERFQYRNRWKTHVRKCTGAEPVSSKLEEVKNMAHKKHGQFKCTFCDQIFKKTNRLEKHAQTMHPGMKKFGCELCGEKFSYEISLTEHVEKHEMISGENDAGEDLMMMMVETAGDIETETIQTEIVDSFQHEQIIECETVFETDSFETCTTNDNFETHTIQTDINSELEEIRKSPRKRSAKKAFEEMYEFKKQRRKV